MIKDVNQYLHSIGVSKHYLTIIFLLFMFAGNTYAQLSPGDLTNAHSKLEGLKNCTKCHELGEKVTSDKCLACHKEIKALVDKNSGYHSSAEVKSRDCSKCHSEHMGRNFQIVRFDENKFDHSITGFKLTGKHLQADCNKCHLAKFIKNTELKKGKKTFLGLGTDCQNCHENIHQKTLGNNCSECHDTESFKPAVLFDHNKAHFKLTGLHIKVDCVKCHKKETRKEKEFQQFKNLAFNSCTSCHTDFHKGKFGENCESCHNTSGFKNVRTSTFDHSKTNFQLVGKHQSVKCADCHGLNLASKPKYKQCIDCHKDYHKGQFTRNNVLRDCSECHNENGFMPSLFTIEKHQVSNYTLTGSHLAVSCKNCHQRETEWNFVFKSHDCISCHKNVHGTEISAGFLGDNSCENCHNTMNWGKINFDHSKTKFVLEGKHKTVQCRNCHTYQISDNKVGYKFVSLKLNCENCHNDIHHGQFKTNNQTNCSTCHLFDKWIPTKFDHEKTKFSLKGAHSKLKCLQCHKPAVNNGIRFIKYKLEEFKCANCHTS